ncbi:signal-regulatory protein beta-2-like [Centropristis striata]|uniref:signal-regulatory protein beta-2-like n=1 Tax=Centropristis striata TaxID=184440 RepID=UPI0027DED76D|nr:signal-regulatory protein beta-2-like [Centropristis striata]
MTSLNFVFYLTCLFLGKMAPTTTLELFLSVRQESGFRSVNVGDSVTLRCFYEGDVAVMFYWYKQTLGRKPTMISNFYTYDKNGTFIDDLKNDPRFKLETKNGNNHLTISDLRVSDSATYYCVGSYTYKYEFAEGTTVEVKGSGFPVLVHQSASETVQPGGSVTLNCTVHTGTCEGEHSVYWFKNSEESPPGLIYTHGGRNDQCERNTKTQTCVYNLPMKSLNLSHAGTYYCAVVSCGHILFGNGTKLDIECEVDQVYFLRGALTFTTILSFLLALTVCMTNKDSCKSTESRATFPTPSTANPKDFQHAEKVYNGFSVNLHNRSGRLKDPTWSECVYNSVNK